MAALERLITKAEGDPEDEEEIARDLAELKSRVRFTVLDYAPEGDYWAIDAAMSPGTKKKAKKKKTRRPEGDVDTYGNLLGPTGDRMTPDHEPQDTLMQYVADELRWEKNERLFSDTSLKRDYSKDAGICLNLHELRHRHTLSYGRSRSPPSRPSWRRRTRPWRKVTPRSRLASGSGTPSSSRSGRTKAW